MRKLVLLLLLAGSAFGQSKVEFTKEGITPIVTEVEGMTAEQLYKKTQEWIQFTYKNPSKVSGGDIPNEMLRVNGFGERFFEVKSFLTYFYNLSYSIEFGFKDGKYKFQFVSERISHSQTPNILFSESDFFKKEGEVRKVYKNSYETYLESVEKLYQSHYDYISGKTSSIKKDW